MDFWKMTKIKRPQQIQHWGWQCTNEGSEIEDKALLIQRRKKKPLYVKKRLHHDDMFKEWEFWSSGHKTKSKSVVFLKEETVRSVRSLMRVSSQNLVFVESRAGVFPFCKALCRTYSESRGKEETLLFRIFTHPHYSLTKLWWKGALVNALAVFCPNWFFQMAFRI